MVAGCGIGAAGGSVDNYLGSDGNCHPAPHSCHAGQYLDGDGNCVAMSVSGTANRLAMFTDGTSVSDSIVTQSGTEVTVAGALTVDSLTVTNGLPITVSNEYSAYQGDGAYPGEESPQRLELSARSACFLTKVRIHDSYQDNDLGRCRVSLEADPVDGQNYWWLHANRQGGVDVRCQARCIRW